MARELLITDRTTAPVGEGIYLQHNTDGSETIYSKRDPRPIISRLASLFYPPLRAIIGSVTTSAAILVGGLALIILPTLIAGNELLILGGVAFVVGQWFLAHRHGKLQGFVDANKNGIDDRLETLSKR